MPKISWRPKAKKPKPIFEAHIRIWDGEDGDLGKWLREGQKDNYRSAANQVLFLLRNKFHEETDHHA